MLRITALVCTLSLWLATGTYAQLVVSSESPVTPAYLDEIIHTLVGNDFYVVPGSVSIGGNEKQVGMFSISGSLGGILINQGLVLSTGYVDSIPGPATRLLSNTLPPSGSFDPGDALLSTTTPHMVKDAVTLEFSFRPEYTPVTFRYAIATEEYPDYTEDLNSDHFSDRFGFFVTGQDPAGGTYTDKNIATLPNGQVATVLNIFEPASTYKINTQQNLVHGFNGVSLIFTCSLNVVPHTNYTMRIKLADIGDEGYDSAVFLQANSLGSTPVSINPVGSGSEDLIYPNPFSTHLTMETNGAVDFSLRDTQGRAIYAGTAAGHTTIDLPGLSNGVYFLVVSSNHHTRWYKMIKSR